MLAKIVHHVSYSRLYLNGFYFNFTLRESEKKCWLKQIKLFPVEGQVMTGRTQSNLFSRTAVLAGRCDAQWLTCAQLTDIEFCDFTDTYWKRV